MHVHGRDARGHARGGDSPLKPRLFRPSDASAGLAKSNDMGPLHRPTARSAHGAYTPPTQLTPMPGTDPQNAFAGRPVTHSAISPSKDFPKMHADPMLGPVGSGSGGNANGAAPHHQPQQAGQVDIMTFVSSLNNDLMSEARILQQGRDHYENIIGEQRRKNSNILRQSTDSLERIDLVRPVGPGGGSGNGNGHNGGHANGNGVAPISPFALMQAEVEPRVSPTGAAPTPGMPKQSPVPAVELGPGVRAHLQNRGAKSESPTPGRGGHGPKVHNPTPPLRPSSDDLDEGPSQSDAASEETPALKRKKSGKRRHLRGTGRIKVVVRKRPLNAAGQEGGEDVVETQDKNVIVQEHKERIDLSKYTERQQFAFDAVYDMSSSNRDLYIGTARPLLDTFFEGGNASVFAYGQTGSGKTHTMLGHGGDEGLYLLCAHELFARLVPTQSVKASFYEIYCNTLYDLLGERKVLFAREDGNKRVNIVGLSEHFVTCTQDMLKLMEIAEKQRSSGATAANELSSRSHAILALTLFDNTYETPISTFKFIDLAGSERGADSADRGRKTQQEGAEINKSLLALKECIRGLDLGHNHIKFRGSKLTEVLRDSFTGNCRTVMIATLSPSSFNVEHTLNTLRYANRVKGLPIKSVDPSAVRNAPRKRRSISAGPTGPNTPLDADNAVNPPSEPPPQRMPRAGARGAAGRRAKSQPLRKRNAAAAVKVVDLAEVENASGDSIDSVADGATPRDASALRMKQKCDALTKRNADLESELAAMRQKILELERAHKQEINMCKMVKKMDEQRIALLEDHNITLQKKIQETGL